MQTDEFTAATERINAGEEIPPVEPSLIEHIWNAISSMPRQQRQHTSATFAHCDPSLLPSEPEQQVAMMTRYALLAGLIEQGILDDYMADEPLRKKVFATAASMPATNRDLGEALAERLLRESPPDAAQKTREELRQAGCDLDHPKVGARFLEWMRDNG